MTEFILNPKKYDLYEFQQRASKKFECPCEFLSYGCLLDNFMIFCKNGIALFTEQYVNCWQSTYHVYFARYEDKNSISTLYMKAEKFEESEEEDN